MYFDDFYVSLHKIIDMIKSMEAKEFKEKAEKLLQKLVELKDKKEILSQDGWDTVYSPDQEIHEQIREFVHLVYAFDKDLPLNRELSEYKEPVHHLGDNLDNERKVKVLWYIDRVKFFIHYIEEYVETKQPAEHKKYEKW